MKEYLNQPLKILYLISMPIGNPGDISCRAIQTLQKVPTVIVEKYQNGKKILKQLGIDVTDKKILELNEHIEGISKLNREYRFRADYSTAKNKKNSVWENFLTELLPSPSAALISDAGSPVLADPGFRLFKELLRRGVRVTHVAGGSSLISGLLLSGFSLNTFYYAGFLPQKSVNREQTLRKMIAIKDLIVIMETPYRLTALLHALKRIFPPTIPIAITFSLSTLEEEVFRGTLSQACIRFSGAGKNRRPFVLLINNRR